MRKLLFLLLLIPAGGFAQQGSYTVIRTSGNLPSSCVVGGFIQKTGTSAGMYFCSAANTWTGPLSTSAGSVTITKTCHISLGSDDAASDLTTAQIQPQHGLCYIDHAGTAVEIKVKAAGGTPNIIVSKNHAGSQTALLSSALATGSSGAVACSNTGGTTGLDATTTCSATLQNTSLAAGDYIDATGGATSTGAKWLTVDVTFSVTY
jgi:hypothetical protein